MLECTTAVFGESIGVVFTTVRVLNLVYKKITGEILLGEPYLAMKLKILRSEYCWWTNVLSTDVPDIYIKKSVQNLPLKTLSGNAERNSI